MKNNSSSFAFILLCLLLLNLACGSNDNSAPLQDSSLSLPPQSEPLPPIVLSEFDRDTLPEQTSPPPFVSDNQTSLSRPADTIPPPTNTLTVTSTSTPKTSTFATDGTVNSTLPSVSPTVNPAQLKPTRTLEKTKMHLNAHPHDLPDEQFALPKTCESSANLSATFSEPLLASIEATLQDVYVIKGQSRLDAISWNNTGVGFNPEWADFYYAAGEASDMLPVQPDIQIDKSKKIQWLNVDKGQYVLEGNCYAPGLPKLESLVLAVPITAGLPKGRIVMVSTVNELNMFESYQMFRWQANRWKLEWQYWCATVGDAQTTEDGIELFEETLLNNFGRIFDCVEESTSSSEPFGFVNP